jgi:hypothetical protein
MAVLTPHGEQVKEAREPVAAGQRCVELTTPCRASDAYASASKSVTAHIMRD